MKFVYAFFSFLLLAGNALAQDTVFRVITIKELFSLTESNAKQLDIAQQGIQISRQRTEIAKSDRLPEIVSSADAGYLSTISILNPDFSFNTGVKTPHFTNNYAVEASEIIYKGGFIHHNIEKSKLGEQLSVLTLEKDKQEIKLLLLGKYLQLFQLENSRVIYLENIQLAKHRLNDLTQLQKQGLVIRNDLIRNELLIKDFELDLEEVNNNITILNRELCVYLNLTVDIRIKPDTLLVNQAIPERVLNDYLEDAYRLQPAMKTAVINEKIAGKNVHLEKSARTPTLSLYAGDALQRPFLNTLEPLDVYYNAYQTGIKLTYNISSLYHAPEHIRLAKLEYAQEQTRSSFQKQQTEIEVHTAFTNYLEAKERFQTLEKSLQLANDNYRVVERKYKNQLAQITDILDASTAKLAAELRLSNARINIIGQWYKLQKSAGNF